MELRITGGTFGGRNLEGPREGKGTRPTIERVREALFDILASRLAGMRVLDLCAGTGALGLEALSHGAKHITFVESNRRNAELIQENIRSLGVEENTAVIQGELPYVLGRIKGTFELVLFDPPYRSDLAERVLEHSTMKKILAPSATVILERDRRSDPLTPKRFAVARRHRIGDTELWFFQPQQVRKAVKNGSEDE